MTKGKATAIDYSLSLYNTIKKRGIQIILVSSRREHLRAATIDNLLDVGFYGWKSLYLRYAFFYTYVTSWIWFDYLKFCDWFYGTRSVEDECKMVQEYKASVRSELINNGYRIWGILGDQWSSIRGIPTARRTFKLPNSLYYVAWNESSYKHHFLFHFFLYANKS